MDKQMKDFENLVTMTEIRKKIETLDKMADIYSGRDRVRFDEIMKEVKAKEMELLDLMSENYLIG